MCDIIQVKVGVFMSDNDENNRIIEEEFDQVELTKEAKRRYLILKDPNIYKGLIALALPVMASNFIRSIHDVVDMYFVSRIEDYGSDSVASISITFPIIFMFISLGFGLSIAGTALISQLIGSGQRPEAKRYATNLFLIALITGFLLNIIGYFGAPLIMRLMGAEDYLLEKSVNYLQIRSFELVPLFIGYSFMSIRQSDGDTVTPVVFTTISIIINIILSPILIMIFNLGVEGAAYATLFGNSIVVPFILYQLYYSKSGLTINKQFRMEGQTAQNIIFKAIPASMGQSITAIGFAVMNGVIVSYGVQTVAAFSVGNRISSLVLHPVMAIGGVLAAYIGQNIGNANSERARESFKKGLILSLGIITTLSLIMMFIRRPVAGLFLDNDPEALELATTYLFFLLIGLPLMAIFQTFLGSYNGNGKTIFTFIISVSRLWLLRIPLILSFTYFTNLGSSGIWTAMLISNFVIVLPAYIFYRKLDFKPQRNLDI